ncbi:MULTISPECIES: translation initiation factor IF-3 [Syntrophotalea]|uniref:Translation initiation factor IF-3 n=1 Tax=Syntrophotalea acetylenica TaxID=29542 RepID=A0A1L3GKA3_SYNAC|nr:translation initiation factor IF-3 [Syntrophotalea acetylenica]APG45310.1 translation initiation factor IF-3 [Syntrophotalea acetylenica]
MAKEEARVNRAIRAKEVRVVDDEGEMLGVMSVNEALLAAEGRGLDLVEVSPNATPPVCRIMDYGKYKYQASKRAAETKKKSARVDIKEVKMRPKTEEHDFQVKLRNAVRFLEDGNKVKVTVMFRGREVTHPEFGMDLMKRVAEEIGEAGQVEMTPRMAGRFMTMVIAPKKK